MSVARSSPDGWGQKARLAAGSLARFLLLGATLLTLARGRGTLVAPVLVGICLACLCLTHLLREPADAR